VATRIAFADATPFEPMTVRQIGETAVHASPTRMRAWCRVAFVRDACARAGM
jgi:hypothetical protein